MSYLLAAKPAGCYTSSPDCEREGMCEYLSRQTGEQLRAPSSLDAAVSGAVVFARSDRTERELVELLRGRRIKRQYLAVTDRPLPDDGSISTDEPDRVSAVRHTSAADVGSGVTFRRYRAAA